MRSDRPVFTAEYRTYRGGETSTQRPDSVLACGELDASDAGRPERGITG